MTAAIFIRKVDKTKSVFCCNNCKKEFTGYDKHAAMGYLKFCSKLCIGAFNKSNRPKIKIVKQLMADISARVMSRDALIIERHINEPDLSFRELAVVFNVTEVTIRNALEKYWHRGGDTVLTLNSGIDTEKAIQQAEAYQI